MSLRQRKHLKGVAQEPSSSQLIVKDESGTEFVAVDLYVTEKLSSLNCIDVAVISAQSDIASWLGQTVSCQVFDQLASSREAVRSYRGVVTEVEMLRHAEQGKYHCVGLKVEPWFGLLRYSKNYRVFQNQSSQEIVASIFDELGFKDQYTVNSMPRVKREYCLQFNETDFDFVRRILAEEGVHFFFGRDDKSNQLILQDAAKPFSESDKESFDYRSTREGSLPLLKKWRERYNYHAGAISLAGYDDARSQLIKSSEQQSSYKLAGNTKLVEANYPVASISAKYDDLASALLKTRRAQLDSQHHLVDVSADNFLICTGNYINLSSHPDPSQLGDYLVVNSDYEYTTSADQGLSCQLRFSCCAKEHAYYPEQLPKPQIQGMHSATVAGATEGEPASDDQGRVRVKFHWDHNDGDKTSCWVRVAQSMAGNGYGVQFIPRVGQEVLISFLEADIDRPVVTGSLHNSSHQVLYPEAESTQSGIRTKLEGESNELRFDDKKDSEELYLHAAKDYLLAVENDAIVEVNNDAKEQVTGNKELAVEKDITTTSEQNYSLTAKESIDGKGKQITFEADDSIVFKVGASEISISSSKIELKSAEVSLKGDTKVAVEGMQVAIKGQAKVDISSDASVAVKATADLKLAGLMAELSGDVSAKVKGAAMAEVSASGMTTVKGGIVMVN